MNFKLLLILTLFLVSAQVRPQIEKFFLKFGSEN